MDLQRRSRKRGDDFYRFFNLWTKHSGNELQARNVADRCRSLAAIYHGCLAEFLICLKEQEPSELIDREIDRVLELKRLLAEKTKLLSGSTQKRTSKALLLW